MYITYNFLFLIFFFFNDTATTEIYTLSLHDALPIWLRCCCASSSHVSALNQRMSTDRGRPGWWRLTFSTSSPYEWDSGRHDSERSMPSTWPASCPRRPASQRFACVSITPFARPVVPPV